MELQPAEQLGRVGAALRGAAMLRCCVWMLTHAVQLAGDEPDIVMSLTFLTAVFLASFVVFVITATALGPSPLRPHR